MTKADLLLLLATLPDAAPILVPVGGGASWAPPGVATVRVTRTRIDGSGGEDVPGLVVCLPGEEGRVPSRIVLAGPDVAGTGEALPGRDGLRLRMPLAAWARLQCGHPLLIDVAAPVGRQVLQRRAGRLWLGVDGAVELTQLGPVRWEAGAARVDVVLGSDHVNL